MYEPSETRYETMPYNRCGKSGLRLPALSVGLWQNFGVNNDYDTMKEIILTAFDHGVTHFDLANNYGPEPGRAPVCPAATFKRCLPPGCLPGTSRSPCWTSQAPPWIRWRSIKCMRICCK